MGGGLDAGILAELQRRYAEPHRAFHRWPRVAELLAQAEEVAAAIADRSAFILAVLFHKAVFDRREAGCAKRSAALMREMLGRDAGDWTLARAERLILALEAQKIPETKDASLRGDTALLLDMDNVVLGAPPGEFAAYEAGYREEFAHLREDNYRMGRVAALQMLLWRERIYLTDRYYLPFEKRARRNVERLLTQLEGR
jgi:predicted metal-dependent HD superfamily phosphohydrolase